MRIQTKSMFPILLAILSSTIAIASAVYQYWQKNAEEDKKKEAQKQARIEKEKADSAISRVIELQTEANDSLKTIASLQEELRRSNQKIQVMQSEQIKKILGDGSMPDVAVIPTNFGKPEPIMIYFTNNSKYFLKEIACTITDLQRNEAVEKLPQEQRFQEFRKSEHIFEIGDMEPNTVTNLTVYAPKNPIPKLHYKIEVVCAGRYRNYQLDMIRDEKGELRLSRFELMGGTDKKDQK